MPIATGTGSCFDHHSFTFTRTGGSMEDYEAQEQEFMRKLAEMDMSRSQMLKRSLAAAAGLTILASPSAALAARARGEKNRPLKGRGFSLKEMVAQAKNEGGLNTIALPPDG